MTTCSDYPDTSLTRFRDISIRTGTTRPSIKWSEVNAVTGCGQSARVISNSATDGEVHITYRGLVSESPWPSIGGTFGDGRARRRGGAHRQQPRPVRLRQRRALYTAWWNDGNGWSSADDDRWISSIGGSFPPGAPIAAITRLPNDIDLFICDSDGRVYTAWWRDGDGWSSWEAIVDSFPDAAPIAAMTRSSNDIDLFICDSDGRVYTAWWRDGDGWSSWESIGGTFPSGAPVTALSRYDNAIDLFVCGGDGHVYTAWWNDGNGWSSWADIGGTFPDAAPIAATTRSRDDIDLFICGSDGRVYTAWWRDGDGWSSADDDRWKLAEARSCRPVRRRRPPTHMRATTSTCSPAAPTGMSARPGGATATAGPSDRPLHMTTGACRSGVGRHRPTACARGRQPGMLERAREDSNLCRSVP